MKAGILTFHYVYNYGAVLQVYALQKTLSNYCDEVYVVNYVSKDVIAPYKIITYDKSLGVRTNARKILKNITVLPFKLGQKIKFNKIMRHKLNLTCKYGTEAQLKTISPKFDVFVCGSDQVWNPLITNGVSDAYFLNFGNKNVKRISYAASIGVDKIEEEYKNEIISRVNKLDYISVREKTAAKELEKICDKKIDVVLDPTLLLSKEEWANIMIAPPVKEKYLLVYVLEDNPALVEIVNYISDLLNLKVIHFGIRKKFEREIKRAYVSSPEEFLGYFHNASFVVTNSFHGTVFSVINQKQFVVIPHRTRGTRMKDFLNSVSLEDRIVYDVSDISDEMIKHDIDYSIPQMLLDSEKAKSLEFLENALDKKGDLIATQNTKDAVAVK